MAEDNTQQEAQAPTAQASAYPDEMPPMPELQEMIDAGVFYGRKKTKTHPKMKQYVLLNRGGIEIINLAKTAETMNSAADFLREKIKQGGSALIVATQPAAEENVLRLAQKFGLPYVVTRWPGGAITNFGVISKRIEYMKKLRGDLGSGALDKYTKKERVMLERELKRLTELFGGFENLTGAPDVLIVVDSVMHKTAVREARRKKIPIIALGNVDTDPEAVDYLVPGNDSAKKSIGWFFDKIEKAAEEGLAQRTSQDHDTNIRISTNDTNNTNNELK